MIGEFYAALRSPISSDRLESYRPAGGSERDSIVNYLWNVELCQALYPVLQALEVSTRNGIHAAASDRYNDEFWFDRVGVLLPRQSAMIQEARRKVMDSGRPLTAGRIVAASTFGFWTSLLNRPYEVPHAKTSAYRLAWHNAKNQPTLLMSAFPYLPRTYQTRRVVWQRLDSIRELRNRVFHHEPVWNRASLPEEHQAILEAIAWISPEMRTLVSLSDRFEEVFDLGQERMAFALRRLIEERDG